MTRTGAQASPFRREGLFRRTAPFLAAMAISYAAIRLPAGERHAPQILAAAALNLLLIVLVVVLPWDKLPRTADLLPPLLYMVVVALLRDGLGGAASAYSTLLILPVLWLAMYGTRAQLAMGVLGVAVLLAMPPLLIGSPQYTDEEWRRTLLWVTAAGIMGLAVQDLVEQVRQRAAALHTVSAAVGRRTHEVETRSAICEAARDNAAAQYAVLLEPDANSRRLVATAATDAEHEGMEVYLSDATAAATRAFDHGRPQLAGDGLWQPIPGRGSTLGVIGVVWAAPVKRVPDTLPAVLEALAAEAAGVIERTTLLLRLETVVKVDATTGLPNERAWEEEVPRELSRARREGHPLSVVILDLGEVSPTPEGELSSVDAAFLRAAADRWRGELGPSDFLAHRDPAGRFAALFPGADPEEAEAAALRLRALAPEGRDCTVAVATWDGIELPAALVGRAETQCALERAALSPE